MIWLLRPKNSSRKSLKNQKIFKIHRFRPRFGKNHETLYQLRADTPPTRSRHRIPCRHGRRRPPRPCPRLAFIFTDSKLLCSSGSDDPRGDRVVELSFYGSRIFAKPPVKIAQYWGTLSCGRCRTGLYTYYKVQKHYSPVWATPQTVGAYSLQGSTFWYFREKSGSWGTCFFHPTPSMIGPTVAICHNVIGLAPTHSSSKVSPLIRPARGLDKVWDP